jgi:hypothetical protein
MEPPRFIFDWSRPPKWEGNWRLLVLIFASLIGHVLVFYLFQVSYPPTERWNPRTRGAMLLSSVDPISAQVLRELDDHTYSLQGAGTTELPAYSLSKMAPKFRPSFFGHEVALKPENIPAREETLPMLFQPGQLQFPPLPPSPSPSRKVELSRPADSGSAPALEIHASLDGKGAVTWEMLPELRGELVAAPGGWRDLRLRISIGPDGQMRHVLADGIDEGSAGTRLLEKIRQGLRFSGVEKETWGWLELRR